MLEAIIIRADGALAETEDLRFSVYAQVFEEAGFAWRTEKAQFFDTVKFISTVDRITHLLKQTVGWRATRADMAPLIAAMQRRAQHLFATGVMSSRMTARAGVAELITAAHRDGLKVAIVASMREDALRNLITKTLGASTLNWLDVLIWRDEEVSEAEKYYRRAVEKLGVAPENCLVIEGTISGARAARAVGPIALTTRSSTCKEYSSEDGDPLLIEDLPSLIAINDRRRLDPLSEDERTQLLSVLHRLHAGNFDASAEINRSSAMRVSDILKSKGSAVKTIDPNAPIRALARALRSESVGVMVVTDPSGRLKGIISERDLARGLAEFGNDLLAMSVADLMTTSVVTCTAEDCVSNIARIMTQRRVRHLPVISGSKLVGLISIGDVLKYRLDEVQLEANVLRDVAIARG